MEFFLLFLVIAMTLLWLSARLEVHAQRARYARLKADFDRVAACLREAEALLMSAVREWEQGKGSVS